MLRARRRAALTDRNHRLEIRVQVCNDIEVGGFMVLNLVAPPRLISISALNRLFSAGASISAKSLKYVRLSEAILDEQLGPERIAAVFRLSACKTAKADCAFVLLAGSNSRYRGSPANWSGEPERALCRTLVGGDFALVNDQATKFVAKHWLAISSLAHGAEAACAAVR